MLIGNRSVYTSSNGKYVLKSPAKSGKTTTNTSRIKTNKENINIKGLDSFKKKIL
jgi:hypothetical protein